MSRNNLKITDHTAPLPNNRVIKIEKKYDYYIGIDSGVNTGVAIWKAAEDKFLNIGSMPIHEAMNIVLQYHKELNIFVRVEDARKRTWFGGSGQEKWQGAGSIKRDAKIWEDFLTGNNIDFELVAPKKNKTKLSADLFKKLSGWKGSTNEHSRDAAMLVFKFKKIFR